MLKFPCIFHRLSLVFNFLLQLFLTCIYIYIFLASSWGRYFPVVKASSLPKLCLGFLHFISSLCSFDEILCMLAFPSRFHFKLEGKDWIAHFLKASDHSLAQGQPTIHPRARSESEQAHQVFYKFYGNSQTHSSYHLASGCFHADRVEQLPLSPQDPQNLIQLLSAPFQKVC